MTRPFLLGAAVILLSLGCTESPATSPARWPSRAGGPGTSGDGSLQVATGEPTSPAPGFLRCESGISVRQGDVLFCFDAAKRTWAEAERNCQDLGGHLATMNSPAEAEAVRTTFGVPFALPGDMWIGLVEPFREGEWLWMGGQRAIYQHWLPGEPNNSGQEDCAHRSTATGGWNDLDCASARPFLCEGAPVAAGRKSTLQCSGTSIRVGEIPYCANPGPLAAAAAAQFCNASGGQLAELSTAEKDRALFEVVGPRAGDGSDLWIGLTDGPREGEWRSVDGEVPRFTAWRGGEPNNAGNEDCALWSPNDGAWNDVPCTGTAASICRGLAGSADKGQGWGKTR